MAIEPGRQLLHYKIVEKVGEGGMGVVWKAVDTSLDREVAIKVLPPDFAADAERLARFEREAKLLASLNHPNIASIYGIHRADASDLATPSTSPAEVTSGRALLFLVMELVDGEDLSVKLEHGPMGVDAALRTALQIAEGLEAAHDNGVIHRDLKPANIRLTLNRNAKILDFGLAKVDQPAAASGDRASNPTLTSAGTQAGMILGTASYMSPEQASGQVIDRRCDIWSFGVVFYEMLTGKRLFEGETISHTLADVLRADVDLSDLPLTLPRSVRRMLERCLERDVTRRLRDIGEARITLQDAISQPEAEEETASSAHPSKTATSRFAWIVTALAVVAAGVALTWTAFSEPEPPAEETLRVMVNIPNSGNSRQGDGGMVAISPDGKMIVTRSGAGPDDMLHSRSLGEFDAKPIAGTAGARAPQFSPDGRWIGFVVSNELHKVRVSGGAAIKIGWFPASFRDYRWADDGFIYYTDEGQVWRMPEAGGDPEQLTQIDTAQNQGIDQMHPLPQENVILGSSFGGSKARHSKLYAFDIETRSVKDLGMQGADPHYLPGGYILFHQSDGAVVARFDLAKLEFTGSPVSVLPRAWVDQNTMQLSIADNGTVAYLPRRPGETQSLVFVAFDGSSGAVVPSGLPFSSLNDPRISPDGKRLVVTVGTGAIWMIDLLTQTSTMLTEQGFYPLWSPDGSQILFTSSRNKTFDVYRVPVDLSLPEQLVLDVENNMRTMDWTKDNMLVLREQVPQKGMDLRNWPDLADESSITNLLDGADDELAPIVSPDGKWLAYVSNYSGPDEIYVTSYPTAGARVKLSNNGGNSPTWSPDGRTLYYLEGLKMMAVALDTDPEFRVLSREPLFEGEYVQYRWSRQYDLHPDGERFVMIQNPSSGDLEVIINWFTELRDLED